MIRQFIKDTGIYGISGFITKGVSVFLVPLYTRVLTPYDYGIIDIIAIFFSIVSVTVPLEITQAVARFLADKKSDYKSSRDERVIISSVGLIFTLFSFGVFLIFGLLLRNWLSLLLFDDPTKGRLLSFALIYMFFSGLFYFFQNQLKWTLKPKKVALLSILYTVLNISLTVYFVLIFNTGVVGIFYSFIISGIICSFTGFIFTIEDYNMTFSLIRLKELFRFSIPLVPSSVGVFLINSVQRIIIKEIMSLSALGLYSVGSRLSSVINLGFSSIQNALTPLVYQNMEEKDTPKKLAIIFRLLSTILCFFFLLFSIFSREILEILTTPLYYDAYKLVPFLLFSEIVDGLSRSFTVGMAVKKRTDIIAYLNIIGAVFAISVSYFFILYWGIIGAAIAVVLKSFVLFILQMYYSQKYYKIPYFFNKILIQYIIAMIFIAFSFALTTDLILFNILFRIILLALFISIIVFVLKIVTFQDIRLARNTFKRS